MEKGPDGVECRGEEDGGAGAKGLEEGQRIREDVEARAAADRKMRRGLPEGNLDSDCLCIETGAMRSSRAFQGGRMTTRKTGDNRPCATVTEGFRHTAISETG